ncbi:hypothetical protein GCM10023339_47310 [Alloalcanivorax gelatiniphagus]
MTPHASGRPSRLPGVAWAGMLLVASTYGLARFGVGLFAPRLAADRPDLAGALGLAAAAQFCSYAVAAAAAARLSRTRPRLALLLAGATAAVGCVGVAVTSLPAVFVAVVFVGGMGAGLASPALVRVVDDRLSGGLAATAQSLVNAGTAVGVIAAGGLALAATGIAAAWSLMAAACVASAAAVLLLSRPASGSGRSVEADAGGARDPRALAAPAAAALVVGAGSAVLWTYGPLLATTDGPLDPSDAGFLWIALGLGGLLGPATGWFVQRCGLRAAWILFAVGVALADVALATSIVLGVTWVAIVAMVVFGAAYMCLSGVLILVATATWSSAPGAATSWLFIALSVGQAAGSAVAGLALAHVTSYAVVLAAAGLCAAGAVVLQVRVTTAKVTNEPATTAAASAQASSGERRASRSSPR